MNIRNAIIDAHEIGEWKLDINLALTSFDNKCMVSRWHNEYRLIRTPRKNPELKISIRSEDTLVLIEKLSLLEIASSAFNNASRFHLK